MRYNKDITSTSLSRVIGQLTFIAMVATGCGPERTTAAVANTHRVTP